MIARSGNFSQGTGKFSASGKFKMQNNIWFTVTKSSARSQKSYYDERAHVKSFDIGQLVWLYWPRPPVRQRIRKLQRLWTGPWRIEAFKSPLVVVIKHSVKRARQTVHVDRLILCRTPPPTAPDADSGVLPDTETATDELTAQDEGTQPLPGWDQDSQSWGDSESPSLSQSASGSGRPTRTRRRPTALDAYILE